MAVYVLSAVGNSSLATGRFLLKDDAYTLGSKFNKIM
jgi:hypothetical protein